MDRLSALPDRALTLSDAVMEFAYSDGTSIYLVTYTARDGAPVDPTKLQFDVGLQVLDEAGKVISPASRKTIHVVYNDPALGTDQTPAQQILANVEALVALAQPWAAALLDPTPLHELLAPSASDSGSSVPAASSTAS